MTGFRRALSHLFDNFGWKLLSLGLAAVLWFGIVGDTELSAGLSVPIQFKNVPADLEISSELPEKLGLEVRGPSRKLRSAGIDNTVCVLDLSSVVGPGERTFTIRATQVNLPSGLTLERAIPSQLRLRFEQRIAREVPVQLRIEKPPAAGLRIAVYQIDPDRARIAGPRSRVEHVEAVQTDPIDLSAAGADSEFRVHVFAGSPLVRLETPSVVKVRIILERAPAKAH